MKWALTIGAALALAPLAAHADEADRFGTPGTIVPNGRFALEITNVQPPEGDSSNIYSIDASPGMLYFVSRNLAVGGTLVARYSTTGSGDNRFQAWGFGIAPEVGFNVPLSRTASFFPTLGFLYLSDTTKVGPNEENKATASRGLIGLSMPFLWHFDNFFMGFGPFVRLDVLSKTKSGRLDAVDASKLLEAGVETTLGGWF